MPLPLIINAGATNWVDAGTPTGTQITQITQIFQFQVTSSTTAAVGWANQPTLTTWTSGNGNSYIIIDGTQYHMLQDDYRAPSPAILRRRNRDVIPARPVLPPEEQQARVRERMKRASAKMRALSLLLDHLNDLQRDSFKRDRAFLVRGSSSGRMYRIRENYGSVVANVDVLSVDGRVEMRLCAHANTNDVPHPDQLLAQKLMIENDEDAFLRIANRHAAR